MVAHGIGILPSIKNLKAEFPDVTRPWYAGDAGALGMFARVEAYFHSLERHGPGRGYLPELSKSVLIVHPDNIEAGKLFGSRHGFKVCMGARYLCGSIKDDESKHECLKERTETWGRNICTISETTENYPQESYATVVRAIQSKWIFIQRVTTNTEDTFVEV